MTNPLLTKSNIIGFDSKGLSKTSTFLRSPPDSESSGIPEQSTPSGPVCRRRRSLSFQRPNQHRNSSFDTNRTPNSSSEDTSSVDDDASSMQVLLNADQNENVDTTNIPASLEIHSLCQNAVCFADLQEILPKISIETASTLDQFGRTPLHVLSENKTLADCVWSFHTPDVPVSPLNLSFNNNGIEWTASFSSPSKKKRYISLANQNRTSNVGSNKSLNGPSIVRLLNESNVEMLDLLEKVVETLWRAYPPAMMTTDDQGYVPFEGTIHDWVSSCRHSGKTFPTFFPEYHSTIRSFVQTVSAPSSIMPSFHQIKSTLTPKWINSSALVYQNHQSTQCSQRSVVPPQLSSPLDVEAGGNASPNGCKASPETKKYVSMPRHVNVTPSLLSSIRMLSMLLECMTSLSSTDIGDKISSSASPTLRGKKKRPQSLVEDLKHLTNKDMTASIVQSIASIEEFVKYFICTADLDQRSQCLETTLMRNVLFSKHSIGNGKWFTDMLQSEEKWVSDLAIDYLQILSHTSRDGKEDKFGADRAPQLSKNRSTRTLNDSDFRMRDEIYLEISCVQNFVPSLLSLGEKQIEEAATTMVVREVLDRIISRPFAVTVVFCDAFFLVLLIVGYRCAVHSVLLGFEQGTVLRYIYLANIGIFYFVIREIGKVIGLGTITRRARVYITFWNLIDFLTTCLALISTIAIRCGFADWRNLFAITTGLMWLRVLSYLKGINMQLATFVLAILQIAKDLIWFAVILLVVVIMFSQMFFTVLAPNECASSIDVQNSPECSQSEYYLKVYAILLGDFGFFNREDFVSIFSIFLAVFFTFATTTILLNVLIAVSSDSYEKCLIRSHKLFGRARVLMIAELVSFQNLLCRRGLSDQVDTWWNRSISYAHGWSRGSLLFFVLSSFVTISWTIGEVLGSLVGSSYGNIWMSLGSVFVNVLLLCSIILFLSAGAADGKVSDEYYRCRFFEWYRRYFQSTMVYCLGSSGSQKNVTGVDHMWQGRILYLRKEMERISNETKKDCLDMVQSMESQLEQSESRMLSELSKVHMILQERDVEKRQLLEMMTELLDKSRKGSIY